MWFMLIEPEMGTEARTNNGELNIKAPRSTKLDSKIPLNFTK